MGRKQQTESRCQASPGAPYAVWRLEPHPKEDSMGTKKQATARQTDSNGNGADSLRATLERVFLRSVWINKRSLDESRTHGSEA